VTAIVTWRVTIAIVGLAVFGYGVRTDNNTMRWVGIACLVVAFLLRFVAQSRRR
jgi:RsiW-degrading membrane proteinase PrsW (M82 family)